MNNILVTDRYYALDASNPHSYSFLISDIGEGKMLRQGQEFRDPSNHLASYGAVEFRAPEVRGGEGWTTNAEVFSFGVIACKVLQIRNAVCTAAPPNNLVAKLRRKSHRSLLDAETMTYFVPSILREAIGPCLEYLPVRRPTMRQVVQLLDDLSVEFVPSSDSYTPPLQHSMDTVHTEIRESETQEGNLDRSREGKKAVENLEQGIGNRPSTRDLKVKWAYWDWEKTLRLGRHPPRDNPQEKQSGDEDEDDFAKYSKPPTLD
jgi:protein tyrosine kinase